MIYLDYNASAPMHPKVKQVMFELAGNALNPSSIHASGRSARKIVEEARAKILQSVNAKALVFCGSATEANNLALAQAPNIIASAIEHDSVWKLKSSEFRVHGSGVVDLEDLEKKLATNSQELTTIVSIMLANNETGIIQPVKEAVKIAKKYGALVHSDAVQAYGRINIDFEDLGVDFITIAAHKIGGPVGVAALMHKPNIELKPFIKGGGQEKNKRAGTENVLAIHGWAAIAGDGVQDSGLRDYLEINLPTIIGKDLPRLPNTSCVIHPKMAAATLLIHFDTNGICVSSGSACSSGKVEVSRTLKVMGVENAGNAIRVSTGWNTTKEDIDAFLESFSKLA